MAQATPGMRADLRRELALGNAEVVRSPEQVALDLVIAGPMSRALAFSIDYGVILILEMLAFLGLLIAAVTMMEVSRFTEIFDQAQLDIQRGEMYGNPWILGLIGLWMVLELVFQFAYFVTFELLMQGRSPGKAAIGLRVVRDGGLPIGPRESVMRNLVRVADMLPASYLFGLITMICSRQTRRLGDYAAGTLVIRDEKAPSVRPLLPESPAELAVGMESRDAPAFRFDRGELAAVGGVELRLIRQTLRRLEDLRPWEAERVLARSVEALCKRIGRSEPVPAGEQRAFLLALLRDAERR